MNVYDFDHTIYDGDSSLDFTVYFILRHPLLWLFPAVQIAVVAGMKLKLLSVKKGKEIFFSYLRLHPARYRDCIAFWNTRKKKIMAWYLECQRPDDWIISASPSFLLDPIVSIYLKKKLIATQMDARSGKITGGNCKGAEKVRMFLAQTAAPHVDCFYSDSLSDAPLANLADCAYLVRKRRGHNIVFQPWPLQK